MINRAKWTIHMIAGSDRDAPGLYAILSDDGSERRLVNIDLGDIRAIVKRLDEFQVLYEHDGEMAVGYSLGDKVWYRENWGAARPVAAIITDTGSKDNRTTYDCVLDDDDGYERWGYADQFEMREKTMAQKIYVCNDTGYTGEDRVITVADFRKACEDNDWPVDLDALTELDDYFNPEYRTIPASIITEMVNDTRAQYGEVAAAQVERAAAQQLNQQEREKEEEQYEQ